MARFEEIGVVAVVEGFDGFIFKLAAMDRSISRLGRVGGIAKGGINAFSVALAAAAIAAAATVAVIATVAAGLFSLASNSIETAANFETAFAGVLKTTTDLGTNLFKLTETGKIVFQEFRDLAKEIPLSFEELSKIGEFAGQLGIADDKLAAFTETVAALGVATVLTTQDATIGLATIANIYGITSDEIVDNTERMASTIVFLGNNFAALEDDILLFSRNLSSTTAGYKIAQSELFGMATAMKALGSPAEAGASAVKRAFDAINLIVIKGGASVNEFGRILGISAEEARDFATLWETEPTQAFIKFVELIEDSGRDAQIVLKELGLGSLRTSRELRKLVGNSELLKNAIVGANKAWAENTALAREAEIRYNTLDSQVEMLKNRFRDLLLTIGLPMVEALGTITREFNTALTPAIDDFINLLNITLIPAIEGLISVLTGKDFDFSDFQFFDQQALADDIEFLDKIGKLGDEDFSGFTTDDIQREIEELFEAISTGIENFTTFVDRATELTGAFKEGGIEGLAKALGIDENTAALIADVAVSLEGFGKAALGAAIAIGTISAVTGGLNPVIFTIGALGFAIAFFIASIDDIDAQSENIDTLLSFFASLGTLAISIGLVAGLVNPIFLLIAGIGILAALVLDTKETFVQLGAIIKFKWDEMVANVSEKAQEIKDNIAVWWEETKEATSKKWEEIRTKISEKMDKVSQDFDNFHVNLLEKAKTKWEEIKTAMTRKWEEIKTSARLKWEQIRIAVTTKLSILKTSISAKMLQIKTIIVDWWQRIKDGIKGKIDSIITAIIKFKDDVIAEVKKIVDSMFTLGANAMNNLLAGMKSIWTTIMAWLLGLWDSIVGTFSDILGNFGGIKGPPDENNNKNFQNFSELLSNIASLASIAAPNQVSKAPIIVMPNSGGTSNTNSTDRSLNIGNMNIAAKDDNPFTVADQLSLLMALGGS